MKTLEQLNKILFGDAEATKAWREANSGGRAECPAPRKPEDGLLKQLADLKEELRQMKYRLGGFDPGYDDWLHETEPPQSGAIRWVDWMMRQERLKREGRRPDGSHRGLPDWALRARSLRDWDLRSVLRLLALRFPTWKQARWRWRHTSGWRSLLEVGPFGARLRKNRTHTCNSCSGKGTYDAGSLGSEIMCDLCSQTGRLCNRCLGDRYMPYNGRWQPCKLCQGIGQ